MAIIDELETLRTHLVQQIQVPVEALVHAQAVKSKLIAWRVPPELSALATLLPWGMGDRATWDCLHDILPKAVQPVFEEWRTLFTLTQTAGADEAGRARRLLKLRSLMRAAHLSLDLVLLTIADHAVRVQTTRLTALDKADPLRTIWYDTEDIFLPLAEQLGLWRLRRRWVEASTKNLYPAQCAEGIKLLAANADTRADCIDAVLAALVEQGAEAHGISTRVRTPQPGVIFHSHRQGEPLEDLCSRVTFDLLVPNIQGCYHALELVHKLGVPVRGRFTDYVAQPKPNGYQALHTAVTGRTFRGRTNVLIEFRIRSESMRHLNDYGVLMDYLRPGEYAEIPTWWHDRDAISDRTQMLLASRPIAMSPQEPGESLYVFTPTGEVRVLTHPVTALDFAYDLHTQMGHHCRSIEVNGESVPHSHELNNGDLVVLQIDPYFRGPDPDWSYMVHKANTRRQIRRALAGMATAIHPGRQLLFRYLRALEDESGFVVPQRQLETYIRHSAEASGMGSPEALYAALVLVDAKQRPRASAERVISHILESELGGAVVDLKGQPLLSQIETYGTGYDKFRFCPSCKPVWGVPIVVHVQPYPTGGQRLVVHRDPAAPRARPERRYFGIPLGGRISCLQSIAPGTLRRDVKWAEALPDKEPYQITTISADRLGLVGDLLQVVYAQPRVNLLHLQADVDEDGRAVVAFLVECEGYRQAAQLRRRLESSAQLDSVEVVPSSRHQGSRLLTSRPFGNPFSAGDPVQRWEWLVGREAEIQLIRNALHPMNPIQVITLHGQRRIGKTSLALMLRQALRGLAVRPVYVDLLETASDMSCAHVYYTIATAVNRELFAMAPGGSAQGPVPLPTLATFAVDPTEVLLDFFRGILNHLRPQRLLLMLDEFNVLVGNPKTDSAVFNDLRRLTLYGFEDLTLMPITHSVQYEGVPGDHPVQGLYMQGLVQEMRALDSEATQRLITERVRGRLQFEPDVVARIVERANGHPYVTNMLCHILTDHVWETKRSLAKMEDLKVAEEKLAKGGITYFSFLRGLIALPARPLVLVLAAMQRNTLEGGRLGQIARRAKIELRRAEVLMRELESFGIVVVNPPGRMTADSMVRISVGYFADWARPENWSN